MAEIFVSYTNSDRDWALWVAKELQALGHTPRVHEWEIAAGESIVTWMVKTHDAADHVLCIVSDEYLKAAYSIWEREAAQWAAAKNRPGFALFVVVKPCRLPTLADHVYRCELFGIPEDAAHSRFLSFMTAPAPASSRSFPGSIAAVSNISIRVPTHFLGREESMAAIEAALRRHAGRVAVTALHGLRGVGKTTLAAAYAERHRGAYRATWWIRAQTEPTIRADLIGMGARLGWIAADENDASALSIVAERLRYEGDGILLIFDNAVDADGLKPWLPRGGVAQVLVTSNAPSWRGVAEPVEIAAWPATVGAEYLIARTGRTSERAVAEALSASLGGLPLAHEQAAAYCERLGVSLAEYGRRFEATPAQLLDDERSAPAEYYDRRTTAKTYLLAIEEATKLHPAAEPLIVFAALLPPEPLPLFLFAEGRQWLGEPLAALLAGDGLDEAIAALRTFALVDRVSIQDERDLTINTDSIRLHFLVRQIASMRQTADAQREMRSSLIQALISVYPHNVYNDTDTWPRARRLDPLALSLATASDMLSASELSMAWLLGRLARYRHGALGAYIAARSLFERALTIRERVLGPAHPGTVESLSDLASLMLDQGHLHEAKPLLERALAISESTLGPEDSNTVTCLNNLGRLHQNLGDFARAEPLLERALIIREKFHGQDHAAIVQSLHSLGRLRVAQRNLADAMRLNERALLIREETVGRDHPDTATCLNNLAFILSAGGDAAAAQLLLERALTIYKNVLGPEHPYTAAGLDNLARAMHDQGNLVGAKELFERALAVREVMLGPASAVMAHSLNNLANVVRDQKDLSRAQKLYERALAIFEIVHGSEHSNTVSVRRNLESLNASL